MKSSHSSLFAIASSPSIPSKIEAKRDRTSRFTAILSRLGNSLQTLFLSGSEPKVYLRRDRNGQTYLKIYDPISRQFFYCETQTEARAWLEQRYYQ
jgi:hypothetical protein